MTAPDWQGQGVIQGIVHSLKEYEETKREIDGWMFLGLKMVCYVVRERLENSMPLTAGEKRALEETDEMIMAHGLPYIFRSKYRD
jgi:hypothetical protein